MAAGELEDVVNTPAGRKYERDENGRKVAKPELVRPGLIGAVNL